MEERLPVRARPALEEDRPGLAPLLGARGATRSGLRARFGAAVRQEDRLRPGAGLGDRAGQARASTDLAAVQKPARRRLVRSVHVQGRRDGALRRARVEVRWQREAGAVPVPKFDV